MKNGDPPETANGNHDPDPDIECPVCATKTDRERWEAEGLILTGVQAIIERDTPTVQAVYDQLTAFEGHAAISLYALLFSDMCELTNTHPQIALKRYRNAVNAKLAKAKG